MKRLSTQLGMSLLELLISFVLSALLLFFLMQNVLQLQHQAELLFERVNEILEFEWVSDFIQARLRLAGYSPCQSLNQLMLMDKRGLPLPITIFDFKENLLTFRHVEHAVKVIQQVDTTTLKVSSHELNAKYPIWIGDCVKGEIHQLTKLTPSTLTLLHPLHYHYTAPFFVGEWITESFFIRRHTLFYRYHRVDELSPYVQAISIQWESKNSRLLQILMKWKNKDRLLEIKVDNL